MGGCVSWKGWARDAHCSSVAHPRCLVGLNFYPPLPLSVQVWMPLLLEEVEKEQPSFKYLG